jgi:uncharacterized membrane protein
MKARAIATLRRYLVAGLLIWIPLGITAWVLSLLVGLMDQTLLLLPERYRSEAWLGTYVPGLGVILTVAVLLLTGAVATNIFGKRLVRAWETVLSRIPIVRSVYGGVKQVSVTLFSPDGNAFRRAVLVRFPHQGAWTVALVTGMPRHEVAERMPEPRIAVFVPTTPNITAGFFFFVREEDTLPLDMSVDAALKYIISMGVVEPPRRATRQP